MLVVLYILLAIAALVILPFSHIIGVGIFAALLFWAFHIHPAAVFGLYVLAYALRSVLVLLGLAGAVSWFSRKSSKQE